MPVNSIVVKGDRETFKQFTALEYEGDFYDDYITTLTNGNGQDIFSKQQRITSITLPSVTVIRSSTSITDTYGGGTGENDAGTFAGCPNLKSIYLPAYIGGASNPGRPGSDPCCFFANCPNLETVYMPNYHSVNSGMFENCPKLVFADDWIANLVEIQSFGFVRSYLVNGNFEKVSAINANTVGNRSGRTFALSPNLRRIYLPLLSSLGNHSGALDGCPSLEIFRMPLLSTTIPSLYYYNGAGWAHPKMKLIDYGSAPSTYDGLLNNMIRYTKILILRKTDAITTLANSTAFTATTTPTPIKVYVPSALKSSYEAGTNWSTVLANNYVAFYDLEGSPYEAVDFDDTAIYNADRSTL